MSLKIGIQMYSVRNAFAENPMAAIRNVCEIGYKYIELANLNASVDCGCGFGISAKELKNTVRSLECEIFSTHIEPLNKDNIDKVLEYYAELGTKYIVSKQCNSTIEDVKIACENYNYLGERCKNAGIQHLLHLGQTGYCEDGEWAVDKIAKNTTKENLMFEVDTYWMLRSGFNPCNVIQKYGNRTALVHQKDLPLSFSGVININSILPLGVQVTHANVNTYVHPQDFCEIGTGQMNLKDIIDSTRKYTSATHIVLEQDYTSLNEFESIQISLNNLKEQNNIELG